MNYLVIILVERRRRCGTCVGCNASDCGKCQFCLDKQKFGGKGLKKQCCISRRCNNLGIDRELMLISLLVGVLII